MNNNAWFKKENPLLSLHSMGGGAAGSLMQGAATKPYVDDVFTPYVWTGTGSSRDISNGIDLSGKGGMVWIKKRDGASIDQNNVLFDTERDVGGVPSYLAANASDTQDASATLFSAFNSDGFTVGSSDITNGSYSTPTYGSWSFRKQAGFFDIVTWTGNGSSRTISHSLGSVPGMILVKNTSSTIDWTVWHRGAAQTNATNTLTLNSTAQESTNNTYFDNGSTPPTSTNFTVHTSNRVNADGDNYVAYVFAGGASSATDKAVSFDGSDDKLTWAATSDFTFGTGAYTVEYWIYYDNLSSGDVIFSQYTNANGGFVISSTTSKVVINQFGIGDVVAYNTAPTAGVWTHYAFVRESTSSNKTYIFVNGELKQTGTDSTDWSTTQISALGGNAHPSSTQYTDCKISNFRITKGQALYTTNFNVPHDPLTTTSQDAISSNVKVICCNGDTVTASTKTPGTITAVGSPTQTTDNSIFDDTSAYVFGDDEDEGIIKTGKYVGNGAALGPNIDLGWEPQYLLIKNTDLGSENWHILDNIRGIITTDTGDAVLSANTNGLELSQNIANLTSTGFRPTTSDDKTNGDGHRYIYTAIRRPDGYVGKPAEAGTDVFAMDVGNASSDIPTFDSGFPVDFAIMRNPASEDPNFIGLRLTGKEGNRTNSAEASTDFGAQWAWGSNSGWCANSNYSTGTNSWMWKRHAGFDVVTWSGDDVVGREIRHSLNAVPEMIWVKNRSSAEPWAVYHHGVNGGTTPWNYYLKLNTSSNINNNPYMWNQTAPTSTAFTIIADNMTNGAGSDYIAMLFSSVEGISKVGYYTGNGTGQTITTGFQPRFVIIKRTENAQNWFVLDTTRGWGSGNDNYILLNDDAPQASSDFGAPTSTGFTLTASGDGYNANSEVYVYYAHA